MRYRLPDVGAAVYIEPESKRRAEPPDGFVYVTYVGDDRPFLAERSELTVVDEDDYCAECGQLGCTADGRDRS